MKTKRFLVLQLGLCMILCFILSPEVDAQEVKNRIQENHKVYVPEGSGPFPVVIIIPGCSGVSLYGTKTETGRPGNEDDKLFRRHWPIMADRLRHAGYIVLIIDYLAAENVINTCSGEIPHQRVSAYISESIAFAKTIMYGDPARINVIGASYGGTSVLIWLANLASEPEGLRSLVTIYPGCGTIDKTRDTSLPLLMILGEADDIAPPALCTTLASKFSNSTDVRIKTYPDARHGFDLTEGPTILPIGNGKTVGRNSEAGNDAWKVIVSFLEEKNQK